MSSEACRWLASTSEPDGPGDFAVHFPHTVPTIRLVRALHEIRSGGIRAPVRRPAVPDDGAPPQRWPCCPCGGAEKAWLVAIRPSDSIARLRDRRSALGVGLKGGVVECAHELPRRHRRCAVDLGRLAGRISGGVRRQCSRRWASWAGARYVRPLPHQFYR